uniref:Uncharacterized protein n=1 Tax=Phlebotomus papatasi TaxID=29031 RepID=A0A1B0DFF5_PHLPP
MKLCFLILTCISEDQYANSMMHDVNLTFKVLIHRAQMRHRKLPGERISKSQPLAATLLVHSVAPHEEIPHGTVPALRGDHPSCAVLPETLSRAPGVSVEGALVSTDRSAEVSRGTGAESGEEVQHLSPCYPNCQYLQPFYHVRRHIPRHYQQLR